MLLCSLVGAGRAISAGVLKSAIRNRWRRPSL
jgi:hypothetical protein